MTLTREKSRLQSLRCWVEIMEDLLGWASAHAQTVFLTIMAILGGIVWLSRLQGKSLDFERRIEVIEVDVISRQVSRTEIKERLAGLEAKMDILIANLNKD